MTKKKNSSRTLADSPADCPCGTARPYAACCGRYHDGAAAPDAESLMRSRYSAYVRGLAPYLLQTWHASTRPPSVALSSATVWLGLKVLGYDCAEPDRAWVEFVARGREGGASAFRLHERSRFAREDDGRWYYVDGEFPQA